MNRQHNAYEALVLTLNYRPVALAETKIAGERERELPHSLPAETLSPNGALRKTFGRPGGNRTRVNQLRRLAHDPLCHGPTNWPDLPESNRRPRVFSAVLEPSQLRPDVKLAGTQGLEPR